MATPTQTRRILIKVDTQGDGALRDIADKMGFLNKNTKSLAGNMSFLTNAFQGWLGFLGVREVVRLSDGIQLLNDRIEVLSGGVGKSREILEELNTISNRNKISIESTAETYARLAAAVDTTKVSQEALLAVSDALQNSFRLSGATATETTNTIIQLGQAFASGELRGQELRSVMEQNAVLAKLLRQRFGDNIYKEAQKGTITLTSVLEVLRDNLGEINTKAAMLTPTIEQTLTTAMNGLKLAVLDANKALDLSGNFAKFVEWGINRLPVLGAVLATMAITWIPNLVKALRTLEIALYAVTVSNPVTIALYALAAAFIYTVDSWDRLKQVFETFTYWILRLSATIPDFVANTGLLLSIFSKDTADNIKNVSDALRGTAEEIRLAVEARQKAVTGDDMQKRVEAQTKAINDAISQIGKGNVGTGKLEKVRDILGKINREYMSGIISIGEYNEKIINFELYKLNREFSEGRKDIFAYNEQLLSLRIEDLNRRLNAGVITINQFNDAVAEEKISELNARLEAGKVSLQDYNKELITMSEQFQPGAAFQVGVTSYIESVGTLSSNIAKGIEQTFTTLENSLVEFVKTGKFNFSEFTKAVLDDLTKIIIRAAIIRPLAQAMASGFGATSATALTNNGYAGGATGTAFAKGGAFVNGVQKFASGGIVDSPTMFQYGGNKTGMMGEAGSEAILPLERMSGGDLGVRATASPVNITILNNSNASVQAQETQGPNGERQIQFLIENTVNQGIAAGQFDKSMKSSYGINRRGV